MKLGEGHEQKGRAMGTAGLRETQGAGQGALLFPTATPPNHPTDGGGKWGGGAINTSRIPKRGRRKGAVGVSERGQGQARATLVRRSWLLGRPWGSRGVPRLAAVLAEVAVALDVGAHQVAHLHRVDLPTFAVADLGGEARLRSPPALRSP